MTPCLRHLSLPLLRNITCGVPCEVHTTVIPHRATSSPFLYAGDGCEGEGGGDHSGRRYHVQCRKPQVRSPGTRQLVNRYRYQRTTTPRNYHWTTTPRNTASDYYLERWAQQLYMPWLGGVLINAVVRNVPGCTRIMLYRVGNGDLCSNDKDVSTWNNVAKSQDGFSFCCGRLLVVSKNTSTVFFGGILCTLSLLNQKYWWIA